MSLLLSLPNVLRKKADQPGGLTPQEAIERARIALVDFRDTYRDWIQNDVRRLKAEAEGAHGEPDRATEHIERLFRIAHEIRGQAGTFGLPLVTEIGTYLCHFVERIEDPTPADLEILDLHVDAMRLVAAEGADGDSQATADMMAGLRAIANGEHQRQAPG
jgi:chemotaxis protein histidine kinase CheA